MIYLVTRTYYMEDNEYTVEEYLGNDEDRADTMYSGACVDSQALTKIDDEDTFDYDLKGIMVSIDEINHTYDEYYDDEDVGDTVNINCVCYEPHMIGGGECEIGEL